MALSKDADLWASSSLNGIGSSKHLFIYFYLSFGLALHDTVDDLGDEFYKCYTPPASASFRKSFSDAIQRNIGW